MKKIKFSNHTKTSYQRLYSAGHSKMLISSIYIIAIIFNILHFEVFGIMGVCTSLLIELMIGLYINKKFCKPLSFQMK